jgi:hypothetical protein
MGGRQIFADALDEQERNLGTEWVGVKVLQATK